MASFLRVEKVTRMLRSLIGGGNCLFAIYPVGRNGMLVNQILEQQFGIKAVLFDNGLAEYNDKIYKLDEIPKMNMSKYIFIVTNDGEEYYAETRQQISQYVPLERICDIFSQSMYFDKTLHDKYQDFIDYDDIDLIATRPGRFHQLVIVSHEIYSNNVEGAVAECGVFRGEFAKYINRQFPERDLYLFDTFSGFDKRDIDEKEEKLSGRFRNRENFSDNSEKIVWSKLSYRDKVHIRKGYFPGTAQGLENEKFAFVNLDMDLYEPIKAGLEFFYPRLSDGGFIFVHDYKHPWLLGVRKAVKEFSREYDLPFMPLYNDSSAIFCKPLK